MLKITDTIETLLNCLEEIEKAAGDCCSASEGCDSSACDDANKFVMIQGEIKKLLN